MDNKELLMQAKNEMIEHSCSMRHTFSETGEHLNGKLFAKSDVIIFIAENEMKNSYILSFGNEYGHGNYRNTLAKQFIEMFTLEQLQNEYTQIQEQRYLQLIEQEKQSELDHIYFESLLIKLQEISNIGEFEIANIGCFGYDKIRWEYRTQNDYLYNYKLHVSADFQITRQDNILTINYKCCDNGVTYNCDEKHDFTETELIEFYKQIMSNLSETINRVQEARNEIDKQKQADRDLQIFCCAIIGDKKEHIFKTKQSAFCVRGRIKFALKGEGKYQNIDGEKLYKLIKEKGITEYYNVPETMRAYDIRKDLQQIEFQSIA